MTLRLWPRHLLGQMLLSVALALLVAQGISGFLLYRAGEQRREEAVVNGAAFRLVAGPDGEQEHGRNHRWRRSHDNDGGPPMRARGMRLEYRASLPFAADAQRDAEKEAALRQILSDQGVPVADLRVISRRVGDDPYAVKRLQERRRFHDDPDIAKRDLLVVALRREAGGGWTVARVIAPHPGPRAFSTLLFQTLFLYVVLVGGLALLLRRITRPLEALTKRVEHFARTREAEGQLDPQGPQDVRRLIEAHNAMEDRITALLDEKDVMLGAIGHDLKTPLAALRVRIENVSDSAQRDKMAGTIEEITRVLDDILSLARVGRPSDPMEKTDLGTLVTSVVEEFEDMGENVSAADMPRLVMPLRETWLRRALRNLIGNAVRYGGNAQVSLQVDGRMALIRIADDGPGIPAHEIDGMMEPFTRGDPSRNRATGGTGLGLTLARAIAEQHGGSLKLANRAEGGLVAELRLPLG